MRTVHIAIVDDEPNDLDHLRDVIETYTETREMPVEITGDDFIECSGCVVHIRHHSTHVDKVAAWCAVA